VRRREGGEGAARLLPEADVSTLFYVPARVSEAIRARPVHPSFLNPLRRVYWSLFPLMPMVLESFDLRGYDLIVSSESAVLWATKPHPDRGSEVADQKISVVGNN
jgi:hypothetical protein